MKRDFLKELGVADELIDKIMTENGKDIEGLKQSVKTLETERDTLKGDLKTANEQISGFKGLDIDGIKKAAIDWEQKAKDAEKDRDARIAALKFDHALAGKLAGAKAKDAGILMGLLKKDGLKLTEDGSILGLDEQLSRIKEEKGFLFESDEKDPKIVASTAGGGGGADANISSLRMAMGLKEKGE